MGMLRCLADFPINGIRIDIANFRYWVTSFHEFPVYDYGGVLGILLTLVIALLAIYPPRFIKNPACKTESSMSGRV